MLHTTSGDKVATLCVFTEARTNAKVFVNPANVRAVRTAEFVIGSQIIFDAAHTITVMGDTEVVIKALDLASRT
jgi:hypothetical protein